MSDKADQVRRSTLATLGEIVQGERSFKQQHGIDIADEDEWVQLGEIVRRIEWKLAQKKEPAA